MKICSNCNTQNVDYANNCIECGAPLENNINDMNNLQNQNSNQIVNQNSNEQNVHHFSNQQMGNNQQYNTPNQYQQFNNITPQNKKSKIVGLILNMIVVGLGYAYVGKWGEGIVLFVVYLLMWVLGLFLIFPFVIAFALWVYSLVKTNEMIDKYNAGLPY